MNNAPQEGYLIRDMCDERCKRTKINPQQFDWLQPKVEWDIIHRSSLIYYKDIVPYYLLLSNFKSITDIHGRIYIQLPSSIIGVIEKIGRFLQIKVQ